MLSPNIELAHIPDDLRNCLETALGEEPSPSSLDQYLPKIKEVIINLLQGLRQKQNIYREQHEAKTARAQAAAASAETAAMSPTSSTSSTPSITSRSKSNSAHYRHPSAMRSHEHDGGMGGASTVRSQSLSAGPQPTFTRTSPRDEPIHAETLASLRKSDAITRRASSRRHSQRFSTLLEQNAPPVPRRQPMDPSLLSTYAGYAGNSQGSTPMASPNVPISPYGQFSPSMGYDQYPPSPSLSMGLHRLIESMPVPATAPAPLPPSGGSIGLPNSATSPLLSSSMIPTSVTVTPNPDTGSLTQAPPPNTSTDTMLSISEPSHQSNEQGLLSEAPSSSSLPLSEPP
ncbi:Bud site selection protein 6, partial [Podila epigama]